MSIVLKSCPFCGNNEAEMNEGVDEYNGKYHVCCGDKDSPFPCAMALGMPFKETQQEAAEDWNRRADSENPQPLSLEQLKQMCGEPIYKVDFNDAKYTKWVILEEYNIKYDLAIINDSTDYGKGWLAYSTKPHNDKLLRT